MGCEASRGEKHLEHVNTSDWVKFHIEGSGHIIDAQKNSVTSGTMSKSDGTLTEQDHGEVLFIGGSGLSANGIVKWNGRQFSRSQTPRRDGSITESETNETVLCFDPVGTCKMAIYTGVFDEEHLCAVVTRHSTMRSNLEYDLQVEPTYFQRGDRLPLPFFVLAARTWELVSGCQCV
eukprot:gnl/MRDRNA2_/MRDRNA2_164769_c0_seq1.p1 gnl/MRDRNA2_/MRDRNA2_164769_c0~~gnl/MRDRNA2_/MRDRNA2_164769_c0_seq1.p1  ORF type:complete len:177 (-),score=16.38 gnl/MRDRNA2_/MRDRNA2_164769_c0_seq1:538-1068(-)